MKLLAHNGKPTNLTPEQYRLVRTPAFKKWFGDWENSPETSSKVVDSNGEPLVVWHGSKDEFYIFDSVKFVKTKAQNAFGNWFAKDIKQAIGYSKESASGEKYHRNNKGKVLGVFLNIRNPFKGTDRGGWTEMWALFKKVVNPIYINYRHTFTEDELNLFRKYLKENSIDGFVIERFMGDSKEGADDYQDYFVALYSEQIKLADGSNKTFDGSNPDIRYADGGLISKYKDYEIEIKEIGNNYVQATITQNGNHIGMISLDDFPNNPYVNYSGIDDKHRGKGLGSYVYQLLDDYSFNKTGKHITHGDINSSFSAIRLWRKRLKDTNYLPDLFYDYWGDDAEEALKELNNPDRFGGGGSIPDLLSIEQIENKLGRKINSWNDDVVVIGGQKYKKVYLRPEYKKVTE